ncbi:MAG: hypothetical protein JW910_04925 [Anaerolineae bacterium]|nr:hypothetical protein [Anaerolineae bacterium]
MHTLYEALLRLIGVPGISHPVALEEIKRMPVFRVTNWTRAFGVLGGLEFVFTLPGCWIPFIYWVWRFPGVLAGSTVISREVENRTWHPLRVTPLTAREIVVNKFAAVFRYMEQPLTLVTSVRAAPVLVFAAAWLGSTLTVLPQRGVAYWAGTTLAFLVAGFYLLVSPFIDVAVDGAIGVLASTLSQRRSTALIMAVLARLSLWMLPLALAVPFQDSTSRLFFGAVPEQGMLRMTGIVANFGPGYAFLWSGDALLSIGLVLAFFFARIGFVRLLLEVSIYRAARLEV